jgi:hypothetical protein
MQLSSVLTAVCLLAKGSGTKHLTRVKSFANYALYA